MIHCTFKVNSAETGLAKMAARALRLEVSEHVNVLGFSLATAARKVSMFHSLKEMLKNMNKENICNNNYGFMLLK